MRRIRGLPGRLLDGRSAVLDALERDQEEVVLVRNQRRIARLVPEAPQLDATSVFGDLYRTLDDETADACRRRSPPDLRAGGGACPNNNPWAG